ncbi:MAG: BrnA antitoxin family protein [Acidobacteriaceae bacterium]
MAYRKPLTDEEGEVREWTEEDFATAMTFSELPVSLQEKLRSVKKPRGPQKAPTKEVVTIRLSRDVVEQLRASGPGWQTRVDSALRQWIEKQPKRRRA